MNNKILFANTLLVIVIVFFSVVNNVFATLVPSFFLSLVNNNTQISLTVIGADPNAPVMFNYPSTTALSTVNLGLTNASGYFTTILNPANYNITVGAPTYVTVDGSQSQVATWPNYANQGTVSGYLSLNQPNVVLTTGQNFIDSISSNIGNMGTLTVSSNSNPSVASVSISNNQVNINGLQPGTTSANICATNAGCANLYITVLSPTNTTNSNSSSTSGSTVNISLSQSTVNISSGQSQNVLLSGPGSFYVSSNSNPSVASTNLNGSTLTIIGSSAGNTNIGVCSATSNTTSCSSVTVNVSSTVASNNNLDNRVSVSISPSNINMAIGQNLTASLSSSANVGGAYYVSSNSNPKVATVNIDHDQAKIYGLSFGGTNVSVCEVGANDCANLYVYVDPTTSNATNQTTINNTKPLTLTSISLSSNNQNNLFIGNGSVLTISLTANQQINKPTVSINGTQVATYGAGSGPYTLNYTVANGVKLPLNVSVSLSNSSQQTWNTTFSFGGTNGNQSQINNQSSSHSFTRYLYEGMTGYGVADPDVTALQQHLKDVGIYGGPVTGYFGPLTKVAVKAYQKAHGLEQVGVVGPGTRALLNKGI